MSRIRARNVLIIVSHLRNRPKRRLFGPGRVSQPASSKIANARPLTPCILQTDSRQPAKELFLPTDTI